MVSIMLIPVGIITFFLLLALGAVFFRGGNKESDDANKKADSKNDSN